MGCGRKKVASLYLVATSVVLVRLCLLCFIFVLPVASPPGGHDLAAHCFHVASGSGCFVFLSLVFPCYSKYFRGICLPQCFFSFFVIFVLFVSLPSFHSLSFVLSLFQCTWVHGVRMLCLSYPVRRWHGFALSTLFYSVPMQYICAVVW